MMPRAVYRWGRRDGVVWIEDKDEGASVTNDVVRVLADLAVLGVDADAQPIVYRDSMGRWDRIMTAAGRFTGFAPLNASTLVEALAHLRAKP